MSFSTLFTNPVIFFIWLLAIVITLTVHEFSHALTATLLGDPTAKRMGRLTLNPFAHIDIYGMLALIIAHFGWGKPVPYNPYHLKYGRFGELLVGLAGPTSNLIMAILSGLLLNIVASSLGAGNLLVQFTGTFFILNIILMVFNLIPLPPLDGSKIVFFILHDRRWHELREAVEQYGPWLLMGMIVMDLVFNFGILSIILGVPVDFALRLFNLTWL